MVKLSNTLLRLLEGLIAIGLLVIAATIVLQVGLSTFTSTRITGANELMTKLFVYISAIGAAVVVGRREHISITFAQEKASPTMRRLIDLTGVLSVGLLNLLVVFYSVPWIHVTGDYLMPTTGLPRYLFQLAIPIGSAIAVLFCIVRLISPAAEQETQS